MLNFIYGSIFVLVFAGVFIALTVHHILAYIYIHFEKNKSKEKEMKLKKSGVIIYFIAFILLIILKFDSIKQYLNSLFM